MKKKEEIYLEINSLVKNDACLAPIETIVALFVTRYCESSVTVKFVPRTEATGHKLNLKDFTYETLSHDESSCKANVCDLPSLILVDETIVAGLCACLRRIVKSKLSQHPDHRCRGLLGFKDSCLLAPSETSVWTKYCEIDLPATLKNRQFIGKELPLSIARFEVHMSEPVRLHNVYKYAMSKRHAPRSVEQAKGTLPEHLYAEGFTLTLADLIIFVCFRIIFRTMNCTRIDELLPLTCKWYERMENPTILQCLECLVLEAPESANVYEFPQVPRQSLHKSSTKRYKPRDRVFTRQEDVESSLSLVKELSINVSLKNEPYGGEVTIDWSDIPYEATPKGGELPQARLTRKKEQLENLCKPVLKLARPGDVIVDFCSGSGHLGILVAHLLPRCSVVLLENKEESVKRSKLRVERMKLVNVKFLQCNLDYYKGHFDIGMSLHACGVATDLVIQHCIRKNAIFVSCPCCYGSVHDCHRVTYPRSRIFRSNIDVRNYLTIGHSADQTHDVENAKTAQGNACMAIIDYDRKLQAEEFGYQVHLAKLRPETCTPKNHLLVGIPKERI